jgi:hypothetical protein
MRRRIAALLMVVGFMLATAAPAALAQPEDHPGQGSGATDSNPGNSEGSASHVSTPPGTKPGAVVRHPTANEHDTSDTATGRGRRNS